MRQINLNMTLTDIGVNPCKNFFGLVKKDHIFVDYKVTVMISQGSAGIDNGLGIQISLLSVIILLQFYDLLVLQIVNPNLLKIGLGLTQNDFRGTLYRLFFSFTVQIAFLFCFYGDLNAVFFTLLHK